MPKFYSHFPPHDIVKEKVDIPYIDDGLDAHKFDLYFGMEERKKNICLIDIHGGSYIFGSRKENYPFVLEFAKEGYDAITIDYVVNDGNKESKELIDDCAACLKYIFNHKEELGISNDSFVLTGDSAGGHLALTIAEALSDKQYQRQLGYDFPKEDIICLLVNSPVYDVYNAGRKNMTKKGRRRLYGPSIDDDEKMKLISPREHLPSLNIPLFVSTCKKDFLRNEPLLLNKEMKDTNLKYQFIDLKTDTKGVDHVHNVIRPHLEASKYINQEMMKFIEECR